MLPNTAMTGPARPAARDASTSGSESTKIRAKAPMATAPTATVVTRKQAGSHRTRANREAATREIVAGFERYLEAMYD